MKLRSSIVAVVALSAWVLTAVSAVGRSGTDPDVHLVGHDRRVRRRCESRARAFGDCRPRARRRDRGVHRHRCRRCLSISGIAPGAYRVRAQKAGFTALVRDVRVPTGAETLRLPLVLVRPGDEKLSELPARREVAQPLAAPTAPPPPPGSSPATQVENQPIRAGSFSGLSAAAARGGAAQQNQMMDGISALPLVGGRPYLPNETYPGSRPSISGEGYASVEPGRFHRAADDPLSTFGADVDTASYANVRRFLQRDNCRRLTQSASRSSSTTSASRTPTPRDRPPDRTDDGGRRLPVGAVAQARADWRARRALVHARSSKAATSCCSSTCPDR